MATLQPRTLKIRFNISYIEAFRLVNQVINMFVEHDPVEFEHLKMLVNKHILPELKKFKDEDKETAGDKFLVWLTENLSDADISQAKEAAKKSDKNKKIDFIIYLIQLSLQNFYRSVMGGAQKEQEAEDKKSSAAKTSGEEMNDEYNIPKRLHNVIIQLESKGYDVDQLRGDALPLLKKKWETFQGSPKEKYIEFLTFWIQSFTDKQIMKKYDEQLKQGKSDYELFNFLIEMGFINLISSLRQKAKDFSRLTPQQKAKLKKQSEAQIRTADEKRNQIMAQQPHHKSFLAAKKKAETAEAAAKALIKEEEEEEAAVAKAKTTKKHLANLLKQQQQQQKQRKTEAASTIQAKIRSHQSRVQAQEATKMQAQEATKMQAQETPPEEKKEQGVAKGVETQIFVPDNIETIISREVELYTYLHPNNLFKKERKIRERSVAVSSPDVEEMYHHLQELTKLLNEQYGIQLIITGGYATYLLTGYRTTDIDITIRHADLSIRAMREIIKKEFSTLFDKTKYIFVSNIPGRELLEEEESSDIIPETIQVKIGAIPILDITFSQHPVEDTELEEIDGVFIYNPHKLIDNLLLATNNFANRIREAVATKQRGDKPESIYPAKVLNWFLQLQKLFYLVYPEFKDSLISRIESVKSVEGGRKKKTRRKKKTGGKRKTRNKRGGRKGPEASATKFSAGIKKKGNDGNIWIIVKNKNGVKRWQRTTETKKTKKSKKKITRKIFKSKDKITVKILRALKKKYKVTTTGDKKEIAEGLWRVRGRSMDNDDLKKIIQLLSKRAKKEAEKLLSQRSDDPVIDYKGMWKPLPKPLSKMSRKELIKHLRSFRDVWESETGRNQDLSDERLKEESDKNLRELLEYYFSDSAKQQAGNWLRK